MNSCWRQLRAISSLVKFSTKAKCPQNFPTSLTFHPTQFSLVSRAKFATAAKIPNESRPTASYVPNRAVISVHLPQIWESVFPTVWLRDNCRCPRCFNQDTQARDINLQTFDLNVAPENITTQNNTLSISWKDGHQSSYSYEWLLERSFDPEAQKKWLTESYRLPRVLWTAKDFNNILFKTSFDDVMNNNAQLQTWLEHLSKYGVALLTGAPEELTSIRNVVERVAFIRRTHYGEEFSVKAKPGTTTAAYLPSHLQLHTDLPFYQYKPGVQMLHCLVQDPGAGGANFLADCVSAAEEFRKNDSESFSALTTTIVDWSDIGKEDGKYFYKIHREPVISLDRWGNVERVNFNQNQRDSHFPVPVEQVIPWYKAMTKLNSALHSDKFCVKYKMEPGDILSFDNTRVLHGRGAYDEASNRHLIGAYLDWDEIRSRLRVLKMLNV